MYMYPFARDNITDNIYNAIFQCVKKENNIGNLNISF